MTVRMLPMTDITFSPRRRAVRDVDDFARSIAAVGLLNPITVTRALKLVAGCRRLLACKQLGWTKIPTRIVPLGGLEARPAELD